MCSVTKNQGDSLSCVSLNLKKSSEGRAEQEITLMSHFCGKKKNLAVSQSGGKISSSSFYSY